MAIGVGKVVDELVTGLASLVGAIQAEGQPAIREQLILEDGDFPVVVGDQVLSIPAELDMGASPVELLEDLKGVIAHAEQISGEVCCHCDGLPIHICVSDSFARKQFS